MRPRSALVGAIALFACACSPTAPRGNCDPNPPAGTVGAICEFENPEDVEPVPAANLLLVSELRPMNGSGGGMIMGLPLQPAPQRGAKPFRLWPPANPPGPVSDPAGDATCLAPPPAESFSPHGLTTFPPDARGVIRVAVVAHRQREAVELFDLTGAADGARLTWRGCAPLPPDTRGNDVSFAPDGRIVVSNYQPTMQGWRGFYYMLKGGLGGTTGDVMVWQRGHGWQHLPGTAAANPNGVLASPDGATIFYAETGTGRVWRVPRAGLGPDRSGESVNIGGHPDNLWLTTRGTILVATHTDGLAFLRCAFGRLPCQSPWSVFEIDQRLHATQLLYHDGSAIGGVASAAEFEGRFYFGAVFDDRIGVWQPAK